MGFVPDVGGVIMGFVAGCRFFCDGFLAACGCDGDGFCWLWLWWVLWPVVGVVVMGFFFFFFPPLFCGGDVFCAGCRCGGNGFCGWLWVLL